MIEWANGLQSAANSSHYLALWRGPRGRLMTPPQKLIGPSNLAASRHLLVFICGSALCPFGCNPNTKVRAIAKCDLPSLALHPRSSRKDHIAPSAAVLVTRYFDFDKPSRPLQFSSIGPTCIMAQDQELEKFPDLIVDAGARAKAFPPSAQKQTRPGVRRKSSGLPSDIRGDTSAPAFSTLSRNTLPQSPALSPVGQ